MNQSRNTLKILAVVEATTVNAVARNVLEFHRAARELCERDSNFQTVEVSIVTFDRTPAGPQSSRSENEFLNAARAAGVPVCVIAERARFDRRIVRELRRIAHEHNPDIVVTHSVKSHFVMFRSGLWRALPWIAFHHGYTTTDLKMRFYNLFDRRSLPKADRIVTVCEAFAHELAARKGVPLDHISVLHNAVRIEPTVSDEQSQALRKQLGLKSDQRIILAVGRLSREKAHIDLINAWNYLCQTNPQFDARLVIVGDGPERAKLEAASRSFGIADKTIFTGHVGDVQLYYSIAHVLANPSHSEGSPYVLLEAMAAHLPIVATAVGGVPEMLKNDESALLVPPGDERALAQGIERMLKDEALAQRLGTKASALVATRFSPENYVRSLVEIYREVIAKQSR